MAEPLLSVERVSHRFGGLLAVDAAIAGRAARPHHRPDRPERRRQDDAVCHHLRLPQAEQRARPLTPARTLPASRRIASPGAASRAPSRSCSRSPACRCATTSLVGAHLRHRSRAAALDVAETVGDEVGLGDCSTAPRTRFTVAGRKRLELARALATEPKLLLLDEVLAGLNPSEIRDIVPVIRGLSRARRRRR